MEFSLKKYFQFPLLGSERVFENMTARDFLIKKVLSIPLIGFLFAYYKGLQCEEKHFQFPLLGSADGKLKEMLR